MIKIGDKVKFDEYLPHNYMTNQILRTSLGGKIKITKRKVTHQRFDNITRYKSILINEEIPLQGIYVGTFRKKLVRSYRRSEPIFNNQDVDFLEVFTPSEFATAGLLTNRLRTGTLREIRRDDDPRSLNKMAMIKVGKRLIGVPMTNVMKCNFGNTFKVL